ncbi:MAG: lipocalin-like domain-containing protein [Oligoflexia bacterium]|nr:lipocalin-like domain-containing protein [Oligoflexia bacterium]
MVSKFLIGAVIYFATSAQAAGPIGGITGLNPKIDTSIVSIPAPPSDWKKYPYYPVQSKIEFPKDEGRHKWNSALEWWYVVMHVTGETTGNEYSVLVTHFSNGYRFFDVTNITNKTHVSGTTKGKWNAHEGFLDVTQITPYGADTMRTKRDEKGQLIPFEYEMHTHHSEMELRAEVKALKAPFMVGGDGLVQIGTSGWSWYYSQTRMEARGVLTYKGITESISGIAWMDHQWGPFLISPVQLGGVFESYEWFCLQLDNNTELMTSNIYDRSNRLPQTSAYGGVGIVNPDGSVDGIVKRTYIHKRYWQDPVEKIYMSMGWQLIVPEWQMDLTITPKFEDQIVRFPFKGSFWEGAASVTGTLRGVAVSGKAFGELMHHFQLPKIAVGALNKTYSADELIALKWNIKNPDDGNPLHYRLDLIGNGTVTKLVDRLRIPEWKFRMRDLLPADLAQGEFMVKISAFSEDKVITSSRDSDFFVIK